MAVNIVARHDLTVIYSQAQCTVIEAIQAAGGVGCAENGRVRIGAKLKRCICAARRLGKENTNARAVKRILQIQQIACIGRCALAVIVNQDRELIKGLARRKSQFGAQK